MKLFSNVVTRWLRMRHAIAAADLAWLERHAPKCIARQRAQVNRLTRQLQRREAGPNHSIDAETIRRGIERKTKQMGVLL